MRCRLAGIICIVIFSCSALADIDSLPVTDDTFANAVYPDRTAGGNTRVAVASWAPKLGFVSFDLSALTGAEVDSASLKLGVQWVKRAGSVGLHLVYSNWDEGTLTYNSMPSFETIPFPTVDVSAADEGFHGVPGSVGNLPFVTGKKLLPGSAAYGEVRPESDIQQLVIPVKTDLERPK